MSLRSDLPTVTRADVEEQRRPGWSEILVGLAVFAVVGYGLPIALGRTGATDALGDVRTGLFLAALSGVAGLAGLAAASRIRIHDWSAFGVRRTSWRWVLAGVAGGILALTLSLIGSAVIHALLGPTENVQETYADAAGGGVISVVLSILFLAVLTPIGEEFLFRGVVATALLRYGAFVGVVGSAVIFALMHGINAVIVTALVVGLIAAELRRRSGSVWPGVCVHIVNNVAAQVIVVALASGS